MRRHEQRESPARGPGGGPPVHQSPGGRHSPWIPIMCSRMRTLSARIFRASRSCWTPSPCRGGSHQGQGRPTPAHLSSEPSPPPPSLLSPSTQITIIQNVPGVGFEFLFTDKEPEAQRR